MGGVCMSIKRHLFFYNTISVFTALVVMLLVSGVTTHFTAENYRRQSMASMDVTATIEVQELLQGEEIIRKDWPALDHQLRTRGYALTVTASLKSIAYVILFSGTAYAGKFVSSFTA